jgi:hypothetical protein
MIGAAGEIAIRGSRLSPLSNLPILRKYAAIYDGQASMCSRKILPGAKVRGNAVMAEPAPREDCLRGGGGGCAGRRVRRPGLSQSASSQVRRDNSGDDRSLEPSGVGDRAPIEKPTTIDCRSDSPRRLRIGTLRGPTPSRDPTRSSALRGADGDRRQAARRAPGARGFVVMKKPPIGGAGDNPGAKSPGF